MSENSAGTDTRELYQASAFAEWVESFDAVTEHAIEQYQHHGFLAIHNAFSAEELQSAREALARLVNGETDGFTNIQFEAAVAGHITELSPEDRMDSVRKLMYFTEFETPLDALAHHPKLQSILARILGDVPVLFQDMALLKPPMVGGEKPWHQDLAYFNLPISAKVVGVWIALDPATPQNGCMHVLPGRQKAGPIAHFKRRDWQICDNETSGLGCVAVPLEPGGCLLFDGLLPHGTPPNTTQQRRRALQFHFKGAKQQGVSEEERLAVFGGEGRGVEC
ncbi:MAG: phytanoyl-CoA dioxygenase family protein [Candidatus Sumerlaeaceae bacterium]